MSKLEINDILVYKSNNAKIKYNFTKGKGYKIIRISGTPDIPVYFIENDLVGIVEFPEYFFFTNQIKKLFCTKKELRKMKLDVINEKNKD